MIANSQFSRFIGNSNPNQLKSTLSTHNRRCPFDKFLIGQGFELQGEVTEPLPRQGYIKFYSLSASLYVERSW